MRITNRGNIGINSIPEYKLSGINLEDYLKMVAKQTKVDNL